MRSLVISKLFDVLTKRPGRLLKKDFYLRVLRIVNSSTSLKKLPNSSKPRLYFDVTVFSLHDNKTGVQRVIRSIFEELKPLLNKRYEIIPVSCTAITRGFQALRETKKGSFKLTGYDISPKKGDVFMSLEQAFIEHLAQEEAFKIMKQRGCRVILAVYDLLPIQLPQCFPKEVESIFEKWLLSTSSFAEFLCDSKTVEKDLVNFLSSKKQKIINSYWFYPGFNFIKKVSSSGITEIQSSYLERLSYFEFNFLLVGTIEPRRGHQIIYDIFSQLWEKGHSNISLTFIGKEGWMVKELIQSLKDSEHYNKNFFWFNDASDGFLDLCYKKTDAVIVASLNEGFGLPILEAAQRNCRVIANDIPIFREVAPRECYFVDLNNPAHAYQQMQDWLKNPSKPCSYSRTRTWKDSTLQILEKTKLL